MTDFIIALVIFFFTVLVLLYCLLISKNKTKSNKDLEEIQLEGIKCEKLVTNRLNEFLKTHKGYLFTNFIFEDEKGFSSEIDNILITRGGIFIIETKGNKGTIQGSIEEKAWLSIKKHYQDDKVFKNPITQNQRHINHLKRMFNSKSPEMISMIIFPQANLSNMSSEYVFSLDSAISKIENLTNSKKYSRHFVKKYKKKFDLIQTTYGISLEKHKENIKRIINE